MKSLITRLVLAALIITPLVIVSTQDTGRGDAEAHHREVHSAAKQDRFRPGCRRHYTQKRFYTYVKKRYTNRTRPLTKGQKKHIRHLAFCLANKKKTRWAFTKKANMRVAFRKKLAFARVRRQIAAVTSYGPCWGYTWAVPCEIPYKESYTSGLWTAVNSNGCLGPYQFCGWSVPWPVMVANKYQRLKRMLAHHIMARSLWNGGAGCSNWEQTSSQC